MFPNLRSLYRTNPFEDLKMTETAIEILESAEMVAEKLPTVLFSAFHKQKETPENFHYKFPTHATLAELRVLHQALEIIDGALLRFKI